jgi:DNA polymerase/3'-5' exonuclease PolX
MEELENNKYKLLNKSQILGLKYYNDLLQKIPRSEMKKHKKILKKGFLDLNISIKFKLVGSFRRKLPFSGDIDILLYPKSKIIITDFERKTMFKKIVDYFFKIGYIKNVFSFGDKKFFGLCKLDNNHLMRRIDMLIVSRPQYPFALLYFTGNKYLNILLRRIASNRGYKLNEYSISKKNKEIILKSERKIFKYLKVSYLRPSEREIPAEFNVKS